MGDKVGIGCFVDLVKCISFKKGLEQYCFDWATLTYNDLEKNGTEKHNSRRLFR